MSRTRTAAILARIEGRERAEKLRDAIVEMTIRYGGSSMRQGMEVMAAEKWAREGRAAHRQFLAVMRLTRALANLSKEG